MSQVTILFLLIDLLKSWPNWPGKWENIFGPTGSGKTHLANISKKKIDSVKIIEAKNINNDPMTLFNTFNCLIIDNYNNNIEENIFLLILKPIKTK